MNIIEQRYDFLVDIRTLPSLQGAMLKRLLYKLHKHKGWLYNYLYYKLDKTQYSEEQLVIIEDCAERFYGKRPAYELQTQNNDGSAK
jgi:hypothetical protein